MKTSLTIASIAQHLGEILGDISALTPLQEGEESQAFSFTQGGQKFILRVGADIEGYRKDALAFTCFANTAVPVPEVTCTGLLNNQHPFAVSRMIAGVTMQDADEQVVEAVLPQLTDIWRDISNVHPASNADSFAAMLGPTYGDWRNFLRSEHESLLGTNSVDSDLAHQLVDEINRLIPHCPQGHQVIHGDFGSNNIIINPDVPEIAAVIDWDSARYGDPLFDIATAYFWRTWLTCFDLSAKYWDQHLGIMPAYRQRIRCYQLVIGVRDILDNIHDGDDTMVAWLSERCRQILREN